jgi:uncharacterized protein (DUF983 family)
MLELFTRTRWDQAQDFLMSGDPPMYLRLLVLNAIFVALFLVRRIRGSKPLQHNALLAVQCMLVIANVLIMLQTDITQAIGRLI